MSPSEVRAWALVIVRDLLIPIAGVFLALYLPLSGSFDYWQLPLIAGMLGVPLVSDSPLLRPDDSEAS